MYCNLTQRAYIDIREELMRGKLAAGICLTNQAVSHISKRLYPSSKMPLALPNGQGIATTLCKQAGFELQTFLCAQLPDEALEFIVDLWRSGAIVTRTSRGAPSKKVVSLFLRQCQHHPRIVPWSKVVQFTSDLLAHRLVACGKSGKPG